MSSPGHGARSVFRTEGDRFAAGRLGMLLFLGGVAMLFGATILGILAIRLDETSWPKDLPPLPPAVWISTIILVCSSVSMQWAVASSRRNGVEITRLALGVTLLLGVAFLLTQSLAWFQWNEAIASLVEQDAAMGLAVTGFHVLTGIHAAHVLGGLIPLAVITIVVLLGAWQEGRTRGIHYTAMYWHFLGIVWLALVITLLLVL